MRHGSLTAVLGVGAAIGLTLSACGHKRPPVVATAPPPTAAEHGDSGARDRVPGEPLDLGPDVRPIDEEGTRGRDIDSGDFAGQALADVYFDYDEATLTEQARAILEKHAAWLQNRRDVRVTVEGHCDERGTVEYNLALGDQRAQAARDYLLALGVAPQRLTTVSYGKERPVDPGHDEAAWARNRRVHFAVSR
jgi:peptidoglycan-associated lipoprotein